MSRCSETPCSDSSSVSVGRAATPIVQLRGNRWKVSPIADWTDRDVWQYLQQHDLPYHPLWHEGFVSIGDVHTTRRLEPGMNDDDTRFFGLKRECGLHEDWSADAGQAA